MRLAQLAASLLAALLAIATLTACGELDPNRVNDEPIYYTCAPGQVSCASGFVCLPGALSAGLSVEGPPRPVGVCVPTSVAPDGDLEALDAACAAAPDAPGACGDHLECRDPEPYAGVAAPRCLFPLQCPAGVDGELLPGDVLRCPVGFRCELDGEERCARCVFVSCDATGHAAASATLAPLSSEVDACLVLDAPTGVEAATRGARLHCRRAASERFTGCPGGWRAVDAVDDAPASCAAALSGPLCVLDVTLDPDRALDAGPLTAAVDAEARAAIATLADTAMSCRPRP